MPEGEPVEGGESGEEILSPAEELYKTEAEVYAFKRQEVEQEVSDRFKKDKGEKTHQVIAEEIAREKSKAGQPGETTPFLELTDLNPREKRSILAAAFEKNANYYEGLAQQSKNDEGKKNYLQIAKEGRSKAMTLKKDYWG